MQHLFHDREKSLTAVNTVLNLQLPIKGNKFIEQLSFHHFFKLDSASQI